jgi:hypothetical protein
MRLLLSLIALCAAGYGAYVANATHPGLRQKAEQLLNMGTFATLEVRYTASQIMDSHRKELLKSNRHKFLEPNLEFYPYLLLEVKYNRSEEKTSEGVMLWDLTDGEMVIDTHEWEKTHGYGDCINAGADRHEFKILNVLAKKGGSSDRSGLSKALNVENDILDAWIDSCRKKKLVVQSGNRYRLHLHKPNLHITPETKLDERLVTKPFKNATRVSRRYSPTQIEKITRAAFGYDFAVRKVTDIYLPVHSIVVQNPDGSIHTSHWNALSGRRLSPSASIAY